jgi:hypothetical protein
MTVSTPALLSKAPSNKPDGPAPMMATCVRMKVSFFGMSVSINLIQSEVIDRQRSLCDD